MKKCYKCQQSKTLECFHKDKTRIDGLRHICKECAIKQSGKYIALHRDHYKELGKQHRENNEQYYKDYYKNNAEDFAKYYKNNEDKIKKQQAAYRKKCNYVFKAKNAKYRSKKINATPKWVDLKEIEKIYENCPDGHHVDHIIPLNHPLVCGLHVPWNLQYLTVEENLKKSNKIKEI